MSHEQWIVFSIAVQKCEKELVKASNSNNKTQEDSKHGKGLNTTQVNVEEDFAITGTLTVEINDTG